MLLECDSEIVIARLHLLKQPRILDCDHRLVGKGGDQIDLHARERLDYFSSHRDDADRHTLAQKRNRKYGTTLADGNWPTAAEIGIDPRVGKMNGASLECGTPRHRTLLTWLDGVRQQVLDQLVIGMLESGEVVPAIFQPEHVNIVGMAQTCSSLDNGIEHGLELGWRAGNDAKNLGRRRLIFK